MLLCEADCCDQEVLLPLGSVVSERLEVFSTVGRPVAWSEACLVSRLTGVHCGLKSSRERREGGGVEGVGGRCVVVRTRC